MGKKKELKKKYKKIVKKIDTCRDMHKDLPGNFGRTMSITMAEAWVFRGLLKEKLDS